jgi:hypothetical protein
MGSELPVHVGRPLSAHELVLHAVLMLLVEFLVVDILQLPAFVLAFQELDPFTLKF